MKTVKKPEEEWKVLVYKGVIYPTLSVSNLGRIKRVPHYGTDKIGRRYFVKGGILSQRTNSVEEFLFIDYTVTREPKPKNISIYVHRAVYETFVGNVKNLFWKDYVVSHKDGNKTNNFLSNLYKRTQKEINEERMRKPENRFKLRDINLKSGYYKNRGRNHLDVIRIAKIILYLSKGYSAKQVTSKIDVSISSVYKYSNYSVNKIKELLKPLPNGNLKDSLPDYYFD